MEFHPTLTFFTNFALCAKAGLGVFQKNVDFISRTAIMIEPKRLKLTTDLPENIPKK